MRIECSEGQGYCIFYPTAQEFVQGINSILVQKDQIDIEEFLSCRGGDFKYYEGKVRKNKHGTFRTVWIYSGGYSCRACIEPGLTLDDLPAWMSMTSRRSGGSFTDHLRFKQDYDMSLSEAFDYAMGVTNRPDDTFYHV